MLSRIVCLVVALLLSCAVNESRSAEAGQPCAGSSLEMHENREDCRTYLVCAFGQYRLNYCPSGFFNPVKKDCDLDYKCVLDNLPEEDVTATTAEMGEVSSTASTAEVGDSSSSPSDDATTTEETPDETEEETPEQTEETEEPTTATTEEEETAITTTEASTTDSTTTTAVVVVTTPGSATGLAECPLIDTEQPTYLTDKQNCERFYLCYRGKAFEMRCIAGMYWDLERNVCDYAQNVKCGAYPDSNALPRCSSGGTYSMPHPHRCDNFIMCMQGMQSVQQCDAFHRFDVIAQKCMIKDRATCILEVANPGQYL